MNIITADFNWISLIITVIALIIGITKANSKKHSSKPVFQEPDFDMKEKVKTDETVEYQPEFKEIRNQRYVEPETTLFEAYPQQKEEEMCGDYFTLKKEAAKISPIYEIAGEEEEQTEMQTSFDIRQAIIDSEILRRPQF